MATKSNNTQGNKYHDEKTGEFTSPDSASSKEEQNNAPSNQPQVLGKISKFKFKANIQQEDTRKQLQRVKQLSSIPVLGSAYDIQEHLEEFFPDEVITNIDSKFGKFSIPYKYFNLRTDPYERCGVNIFAACIGKKRWPNNYIRLIDNQEYMKLSNSYGYTRLFRGIRGDDREFETIANSYSSKENEMIYGSVGGTAYGIAVYSSSSRNEAVSYAGNNPRHVMNLVLNKSAKTMSYNSLVRIKNDVSRNYKDAMVNKVEQIFLNHGIEPSRAQQMARSFGITLDDEGFIAMLCGVEWYTDGGSYHMIENLGSLYRLL